MPVLRAKGPDACVCARHTIVSPAHAAVTPPPPHTQRHGAPAARARTMCSSRHACGPRHPDAVGVGVWGGTGSTCAARGAGYDRGNGEGAGSGRASMAALCSPRGRADASPRGARAAQGAECYSAHKRWWPAPMWRGKRTCLAGVVHHDQDVVVETGSMGLCTPAPSAPSGPSGGTLSRAPSASGPGQRASPIAGGACCRHAAAPFRCYRSGGALAARDEARALQPVRGRCSDPGLAAHGRPAEQRARPDLTQHRDLESRIVGDARLQRHPT